MKKLEKEAVLRERMILIGAVSFFIFILPYLIHLGMNGIKPLQKEEFGNLDQVIYVEVNDQKVSMQLELYLVGALARNSEIFYQDDTLKAIAVVLRSNAVCAIVKDECVARSSFYTDEELRILWGMDYEENVQRYRDVVTSTEGIVIFYDGEIIEVPFHRISAGVTRDSEIWETQIPYISSVASSEDMYSDGYYTTIEIPERILGGDLEVLAYDRFGYALSVKVKDKKMTGEEFRTKYGLPSACFEYDFKEEMYIFHVRGIGHGFGMSLYGADALAIKGWSFAEILQYYYPGIEIRKENRNDVVA